MNKGDVKRDDFQRWLAMQITLHEGLTGVNLLHKFISIKPGSHLNISISIGLKQNAKELSQACDIKSGSRKQHKHKDKINTKTKHDISSGTCEDKTTIVFLCYVFCSALGLCLDYDLKLMITTILMTQASLHSCVLPFVPSLCLCSRVNQA